MCRLFLTFSSNRRTNHQITFFSKWPWIHQRENGGRKKRKCKRKKVKENKWFCDNAVRTAILPHSSQAPLRHFSQGTNYQITRKLPTDTSSTWLISGPISSPLLYRQRYLILFFFSIGYKFGQFARSSVVQSECPSD